MREHYQYKYKNFYYNCTDDNIIAMRLFPGIFYTILKIDDDNCTVIFHNDTSELHFNIIEHKPIEYAQFILDDVLDKYVKA